MSAAVTTIPIRHSQVVHAVETVQHEQARVQERTMLELVEAVGEVTDDEQEIVAAVVHLLTSGTVRLTGNFHDEPLEQLLKD